MSLKPVEHYEKLVSAGQIKDDPDQRKVLDALEALHEQIEGYKPKSKWLMSGLFGVVPPRPKGLYIYGGVGRGKSMLMDLFFKTAPITPKRRVHFHAFMQEDEMQISDITDAMIVGRLFQYLFDAGVIIVTTSNRHPDELYKDGLNRTLFLPFIELIKERLVLHNLDSDTDHRQGRLEDRQLYFSPLSNETEDRIDTLWHDLSGGDAEPLVLRRKGRNIVLPLFRNGVARASFADLCDTALGPGDYLEIAKKVRVLVLTDIPKLSRARNNEAKRFVTLIDALYEAGVRLIASAAAPPEQLYTEGSGAFEFERTASRLREMQSAEWARD
jgi:cell division protein ZapE